ncbi:secG, partial [Symbiodinium microadriaticum]
MLQAEVALEAWSLIQPNGTSVPAPVLGASLPRLDRLQLGDDSFDQAISICSAPQIGTTGDVEFLSFWRSLSEAQCSHGKQYSEGPVSEAETDAMLTCEEMLRVGYWVRFLVAESVLGSSPSRKPAVRLAPADRFPRPASYVAPKIAPAYGGTTSWLEYEQLIDGWCDITSVEETNGGPSLKTRLSGLATVQRKALDRCRFCSANGVKYFKTQMRPFSVKGEQYVFRWRFLGLFKAWQPRLRHLDFQVRYSPAEVAKLDGPSTGGNFGRYLTRIRTCLPAAPTRPNGT